MPRNTPAEVRPIHILRLSDRSTGKFLKSQGSRIIAAMALRQKAIASDGASVAAIKLADEDANVTDKKRPTKSDLRCPVAGAFARVMS